MDSKAHHLKLHETILSCTKLADWIYHDVRLDCDGAAVERTYDRLLSIEHEHGLEGLWGVAGAWAQKAIYRLEDAYVLCNRPLPQLEAYLAHGVAATSLDTAARGRLAANQFTVAISNDDLEMAEAIYGAAASATPDDLSAFLSAVLILSVNISNIAKDMIADLTKDG